MRRSSMLLAVALAGLAGWIPLRVAAQSTDVVVGVPIENGKAGRPQPGVIVDPNGDRERREHAPAPVIIQDQSKGGTTTVTPNFGGGYTVQGPGKKTVVRPKFGGGHVVEENGRVTTEVTPKFGGGYEVKSAPGSGATIVVPPPDRPTDR